MKRSVRAMLLGLLLGEAAVLAFVLVMALFAANAELQTGSSRPLADTLVLWPPLALVAAPAGMVLGLVAARARRRRRGVLIGAALAGYMVAAFLDALLQFHSRGWHAHSFTDVVEVTMLGLWAGAAYSLFAVPGVVGAALLLERWTRAPE